MTESLDWIKEAACLSYPPEVFFPDSQDRVGIMVGKLICQGCPVQSECLDHALETREQHGIYGGASEADRRAIRRHHRGNL